MSVSVASFAKARSTVNCDKKSESESSNVLFAECDWTAMVLVLDARVMLCRRLGLKSGLVICVIHLGCSDA